MVGFIVWCLIGILSGVCVKAYMTVNNMMEKADRAAFATFAVILGPISLAILVAFILVQSGSKAIVEALKKKDSLNKDKNHY